LDYPVRENSFMSIIAWNSYGGQDFRGVSGVFIYLTPLVNFGDLSPCGSFRFVIASEAKQSLSAFLEIAAVANAPSQ